MEGEPSLEEKEYDEQQEAEIAAIVDAMVTRKDEWNKVLMNESIGGNAGENCAGINLFVDKETGLPVIFGNIQSLPRDITSDPSLMEMTLKYHFGNSFQRLRDESLSVEPESFIEVYNQKGGSPQAEENMREAIRRYNEIYIQSQLKEEE